MTPTTRARPDAVCAAAVDTARDALLAVVGSDEIGDYAGHDVEGERLVTHYFASTRRGYRSWRWSVTVTRASRQKSVTVDEIVLLPGPDAVLAPRWVPWRERVQPGDIGPGFLLPTEADDPRLAPGYTAADEAPDDEAVRSVIDELGLGRERVLSPVGRDEAAERWYTGSHGPRGTDRAVGTRPVLHLRLRGQAHRWPRLDLRGLHQRVLPQRRPGRVVRPRLRRPLAGQRPRCSGRGSPTARAGPRHARVRRRQRF